MKWNGWGDPDKEYQVFSKPALFPFLMKYLGVSQKDYTARKSKNEVVLPKANINLPFMNAVQEFLSQEQIATDDETRLVHLYGKSYRDLIRLRNLQFGTPPDAVLYPKSHQEVEKIVAAAILNSVALIPFGGGTNIVGGVEVMKKGNGTPYTMAATLNMQQMNQILSIDASSLTARIQAGMLGPDIETALNAKGFSLGHFPDSFEFSTLGGWLATRSAGMQSDTYGKIEDMAISIKIVTPKGTIETPLVPKGSTGPDFNHMIIGSEGVLGVITEAVMQIHKLTKEEYLGILFPSFTSGVAAIQQCVQNNLTLTTMRLSNQSETALGFALRSSPPLKTYKDIMHQFKQKIALGFLKKFKGLDIESTCLMIIGIDQSTPDFSNTKAQILKILKSHGGINLGSGIGQHWYKGKYDYPYIRDFCMDYSITVDVTETSTLWSNVMPMYEAVKERMEKALANESHPGYLGCHLSHSYQSGACLYFTFGKKTAAGNELNDYHRLKGIIVDEILKWKGALSHHHAIGYEHLPWYRDYVGDTSVEALKGLKSALDPLGICNPGKLIPQ